MQQTAFVPIQTVTIIKKEDSDVLLNLLNIMKCVKGEQN